jgi:hypothetical protein
MSPSPTGSRFARLPPRAKKFGLVNMIIGPFRRPLEQDCVQSLEIVVQILDGILMQLRRTGY